MSGPDPALGEAPAIPTGLDHPTELELAKSRYARQLDGWIEEWKALVTRQDVAKAVQNARADTDRTNEAALLAAVHAAYITTTQSSLDRAVTRMNVVTAAVGTMITVYTALLGYVYSLDTTKGGRSLSIVAFEPTAFLGLALLLVAIYAALLRKGRARAVLLPTGVGGAVAEVRLIAYMDWCFNGVLARSWALHGGITSLGLGIATLPIAFIATPGHLAGLIFWLGLAVVAVVCATGAYRSRH